MLVPIDGGLRQNVSKIEYDHKLVKSMPIERRDDPILLLLSADGTNVIDGTHRLKRRIRDKLPDVKAFLLRPETLWDMRVRMFRRVGQGWVLEAGLTDEQVEAQIKSAKFFETLLQNASVR